MKTKGLLLISLLIFFCPVFSPPDFAAQGLTKLAVGYPGISGDHLAMWVAKETGIFAKNGLDVNLIFFMGTAAAALISGDVPISYLAGPQVINSVLRGLDLVIVAGGIVTADVWLMGRPEIKSPEQLKGGAVAISRFGASFDLITRLALQKIGLNPTKDVTLVQVGGVQERLAAMETGRVRAAVLTHPQTFFMQKKGFTVLADVSALGLPFQHNAVITTRSFIQKQPDTVRRFVRSQVEAVHRMKIDRETGIRVLAKYLRFEDKELLEKTYETAIPDHKIPRRQYPTLEGIKTILDWLAPNDPQAKAAKPEDFVDLRFIKELDQSGFVDRLYK